MTHVYIQKKYLFYGIVAWALVLMGPPVSATARQLAYKTYHPDTGKIINRFFADLKSLPEGGYQVHWSLQTPQGPQEEYYRLDAAHQTLHWRVKAAHAGTDYIGQRHADHLSLRGRFQGQALHKDIPIDARPFYYNPKLGLSAFVLSGQKKARFWGFHQERLEAFAMKAINKGRATIEVGGQPVAAIKVHWTVDDIRSAFFKRVYWFRASDGLYLKQKAAGGTLRELVHEAP